MAGAAADPADELAAEISVDLEPGDLVFKGASTALWTQLAAGWSVGDKRWGHVGIVISVPPDRASEAIVVHADTGTSGPAPGEEIGEVRAVPLSAYLGDVDQVGLFRLELDDTGTSRMIAYASAVAAAHTPFDRGYSLDSANNLYCTELVWRAMSEALGHDAIPQKSHRMGRTYVALSDISRHPLATEVRVIGRTADPNSNLSLAPETASVTQ